MSDGKLYNCPFCGADHETTWKRYEHFLEIESTGMKKESAWDLYNKLYEKYRYKLRIKIHELQNKGQIIDNRKGSECIERFILENTEQETIKILKQIEKELDI